MPTYEGETTIILTAGTLPAQIAEVRAKLDRWLATVSPPPPGQVQSLILIDSEPLRYQLVLRPQVTTEARTIL